MTSNVHVQNLHFVQDTVFKIYSTMMIKQLFKNYNQSNLVYIKRVFYFFKIVGIATIDTSINIENSSNVFSYSNKSIVYNVFLSTSILISNYFLI